MKRWLAIAAGLVVLAIVVGRVMWLNSPMREIERSKAAVTAAKSWHFHRVRHFPGLPSDTYDVDTLCPMFQHTIASSEGSPLVHEWIGYSGRTYVYAEGRWTTSAGTQTQNDANASGTVSVIECRTGPIGADVTSLSHDAMLAGEVRRGAEREVEGESCRDYDVTVPTPHDPGNKEYQFCICINEADHLPRQTRHTPPNYPEADVSTYTKWNAMQESQLPPEIPK
jgi:hypothetical protein